MAGIVPYSGDGVHLLTLYSTTSTYQDTGIAWSSSFTSSSGSCTSTFISPAEMSSASFVFCDSYLANKFTARLEQSLPASPKTPLSLFRRRSSSPSMSHVDVMSHAR